ncbi:response regulator [Thermodesulfobacteriota bacterium]
MSDEKEILAGKRVLAVDDEEDVLEVIEEQLLSCNVTSANTFEKAKLYLENKKFDLAIMDIMGVRGFDLLDIANEKGVPTVMLTAHSMTPESMQKSADTGAASFLPKEELGTLEEIIAEVFTELAAGRLHWGKLEDRLGAKLKKEWGELWDRIKYPRDLDYD